MTTIAFAKRPAEISSVVDAIHDSFFDAQGIQFDHDAGIVTIPFRRNRAGKVIDSAVGRGEECLLVIGNVKSYSINDRSRVRYYDFNELKYHPLRNCITLTTGIPFEMTVEITDIDLSVRGTGKIVDYK